MTHVVMFSGGVGSWAAAKRVAAEHGTQNLVLLFTDTCMEDEDLYRFLGEAATNVGGTLVRLADGRTPWEVFHDKRFLGNSLVDPCSRILKRELADAWLLAHHDPADTTVYVGIDWSEIHRFEGDSDEVVAAMTAMGRKPSLGLRRRKASLGWTYKAPMCDEPRLSKKQMLAALAMEGIAVPRLYTMGFAHNNCGGFCIKAGKGHFARLYAQMPERYREHEAREQAFQQFLGRPVTILKEQRHGERFNVSLRELRERMDGGVQPDVHDIGGCGCYLDGEHDNEPLAAPVGV